jgi:phage-related minor tail protein
VLLTFPQVTKETFGPAQQAIFDLSTRLHHGLQETAIQVGKALQDPIRGITALHRVGVNFSETQKDMIKHLVETGQSAKAQAVIMKELGFEVAGSAKAAADADPLFRFHKIMDDIKLSVGEAAIKFLHFLTPAIDAVVKLVRESIHWLQDHKELIKAIGVAAGVAAVGFGIYYVWTNAISWATKAWAAVQWLLNAALTANPIGVVIVAIAAMVGAVVYAWNKWAGFRAFLYAIWGT